MRRLAAVVPVLWMVACSAPTLPDATKTGVRVRPSNSTILVGQSVPLDATTIDANGDSLGPATVTWKSSKPSVASVSESGVATGLAAGVTTVVATTAKGATDSATIIVNAGGCANILRSPQLHGIMDMSFSYNVTLDSVTYHISEGAVGNFVVDSQPGVDPTGHKLWIGPDTGLSLVHDQRIDLRTGQVDSITSQGDLVVSGINLSHATVSIDTATCAYTIEATPYVDEIESPVGDVGPSWVGWARTQPTKIDTTVTMDTTGYPAEGAIMETMAVHSPTWVASNYFGTSGWYVPLGYSSDYFSAGAPDDGSAGHATVHYYLKKGGAD